MSYGQTLTTLGDRTIQSSGAVGARRGFLHRLAVTLVKTGQARNWISRGDLHRLLLAAILAFLGGAATIVVLHLLARLIQTVQSFSTAGALGRPWLGCLGSNLGLIALAILVGESLGLLKKYLIQRVSTHLHKDLTLALANRLHHADLEALASEPAGDRLARLTRAADAVVGLLVVSLAELLPAICTLLCALLYALMAQPWIGLILAGVVPAVFVIGARQRLREKGIRRQLCQDRDRLCGVLTEQIGGLEAIRAANTQDGEVEKVAGILTNRCEKQVSLYWRMTLVQSLKVLLGWLFQFAVLGMAVGLCGSGQMSSAEIAVYGNLFFSVYVPLWQIEYALEKGFDCADRIEDLQVGLTEPTDRSFGAGISADERVLAEARLDTNIPLVQARQVVVQYRRGTDQTSRSLDGLCVTIPWGRMVGIAGRSGSGKSTFLKLFLRLLHPSAGEFRLGGVPLSQVSREMLSELASYVGQTPFIFSGTVAENLAYGCGSVSEGDLHEAARQAGLHGEILSWPGGYNAVVAERGQNLSGGQRQRLALARAFLRDAPVLVLDEATSALDPENERQILRTLAKGKDRRTILFVTHRLSSLRHADHILVFDQGRVVECGTYEKLLAQQGVFWRLAKQSRRRGRGVPESCLRTPS